MSNAALTLEEISRDCWNTVLGAITRNYRGAHARLEIVGLDVGDQIAIDNRPFEGIAADTKRREDVVWIHFSNIEHSVHGVSAIRMIAHIGQGGPVIEIEDRDGVKTILTLSKPEAHELPPAEGHGRK